MSLSEIETAQHEALKEVAALAPNNAGVPATKAVEHLYELGCLSGTFLQTFKDKTLVSARITVTGEVLLQELDAKLVQ
ncbi:hypothetical protein ACVTMO_14680 [Pseudomonas segetis]